MTVAVELRHLRYFVAVAEELHFGRAARRLFLSQPSLSSQIRRLEEEVGAPLFERTTREVKLTNAGVVLLERARGLVSDVEEALAAARNAAGVLKGELQLRCSFGGQHAVEPLLEAFRAAHPAVATHVLLGHDGELLEEVRAGRVDGAFLWEFEEGPGLETLVVASEPAGVVLPEGHRLAEVEVVPREALKSERVVLFERAMGPVIVRALERVIWGDREPPEEQIVRIRPATAAQETMQDEVAAGAGLALVTRRVFELGHPQGIVFRPLDPPLAGRLFFVWPPDPQPLRDALLRQLRSTSA